MNYMLIPALNEYYIEVKKYNITHGNLLRRYLVKVSVGVLTSIPRPFGAIPKATYILFTDRRRYSFTTTIYTEEECVEKLRDMYYTMSGRYNTYKIYKVQDGVKKMIDTNDKIYDQAKSMIA